VSLNYGPAKVLVVIQMMSKRQLVVLAMLVSVIVAAAPVSAMLYGQGQIQATPAEQLVDVADKAEQQVKNLIDLVYANESALDTIEEVGFLDELESNVTLYGEGVGNLTAAHDALELGDYEGAVDYATEALSVFREVFSSVHMILEDAGLQKGQLVDSQGLLEAMTRQLQRIDRLREILPEDAPEEITQLLDDAEALLNIDAARTLLLEGKTTKVRDTLQEAKDLISQVYDYLKAEAEGHNAWRIDGYCERVRERIQERFRNGNQTGIDFTDVLEALGYQSESQFMETLQNMIQTAKGKTGDFTSALQDLDAIGQMVQEMDQVLTQKMNQYMNGSSGSMGGSSGGEGSGNIGGNYGQGGNGSGGNGQ
jgi:tetratricopeptide (TPR) repeat protein